MTLVLAMIFFNMTAKGQATNAKMNKWDNIKLKSFWKKKKRNNQQNEKATYGMAEKYLQTIYLIRG